MTDSLPAREPLLRALIDICGPGFARPAGRGDTVAGRRVSFVAAPATTDSVIDTMRLALDRGLSVLPRGSGTKIDWGAPPPGVDLLLDTVRLAGVWNHRPAELTADVGTGTPLRAVQAALALRSQRLAMDPGSATATVGGVLALNEAGPLRFRFGDPAAHVESVAYVERSGGRGTSSRVADISGVMLSATLRLQPLPEARRWVSVPVSNPRLVSDLVARTEQLDVEPSAVEIDMPPPTSLQSTGTLAVLLEGDTADVTERAGDLADGIGAAATVAETAPRWWGRYPFEPADVAVRISVPIQDLHAAVLALSDAVGRPVPFRGSAGVGTVHAVLPGTLHPERVEAILDSLRNVLMARAGRAVIVAAPPEIARQVDMASRHDFF
jgi:glycolate dehydrogenase FAD-binding subunit